MEIRNLYKSFGKKEVLHDISLHLENGVYGLLGPNGAGKTTLLRCITGLYAYRKGSIELFKEEIGYLPQNFGTYRELSVWEAMKLFSVLKNQPKETVEEQIQVALEKVNLIEERDKKIKKLSGGMLRRLGIAQTLLGNPGILIYDEPTAGLDPEERLRFKRMLYDLEKEKVVIISTHIVEDVEAVCDKLIVMNKGKILFAGTGAELAKTAAEKVYLCREDQITEQFVNCFIEKTFEKDGKRQCRVLSSEKLPFQMVSPETEDGYLCVLKNI